MRWNRARTTRPLRRLLTVAALVAALVACGAGPEPTPTIPQSRQGERAPAGTRPAAATAGKQYPKPPEMAIDQNKQYVATLKTNLGDIRIALNAKDAPVTVNNFVFLARDGFYNGTTFHRVDPGFVIQGGDPQSDGRGGPGYRFPDEPVKGAYEVGAVAMANSGPNTNGSQFFICDGDRCKVLEPKYNLFGKVVEGIDVVHKIANVPTIADPLSGQRTRPAQEVKINTIEIGEQ